MARCRALESSSELQSLSFHLFEIELATRINTSVRCREARKRHSYPGRAHRTSAGRRRELRTWQWKHMLLSKRNRPQLGQL